VAIKYLLFDEYANIIIYVQFRRFYASCVTLLSTQLIGVTVASSGWARLCMLASEHESESFAVYIEIGIYVDMPAFLSFLFSFSFFFLLLFFLDNRLFT